MLRAIYGQDGDQPVCGTATRSCSKLTRRRFDTRFVSLKPLIAAQHQVEVLKAKYDQANANVAGLEKQVAFHEKRLNDIASLTNSGAATSFREQDTREHASRPASGS